MRCDKNGVGFDWGRGHVYPSDRYKCPECGIEILAMNGRPISDPDYNTQEEYLKAHKYPKPEEV
jgi:hypothetical protein